MPNPIDYLAQMTFTIDFNAVITTVFATAIIAMFTLVWKSSKKLDKIVDQIGTNYPPEGILGRLTKSEAELYEMREWAIRQGYDRRSHSVVS